MATAKNSKKQSKAATKTAPAKAPKAAAKTAAKKVTKTAAKKAPTTTPEQLQLAFDNARKALTALPATWPTTDVNKVTAPFKKQLKAVIAASRALEVAAFVKTTPTPVGPKPH